MNFEGQRVLVTGGAGFIGSHLVERLVNEGADVVVLDNFTTGSRENLRAVEDHIRIVDGDIRDSDAVGDAMAGAELVYHEAALASVPESIENPRLYHDVNVTGTLNVLLAARDSGVRRLIFASSSAVYGDLHASPKREDMIPAPISPYATGKLIGEQMCSLFNEIYGVETVVLRYFNVYGPRQPHDSAYAAVTPKFIHAMITDQRPIIYGDGEQTRGFTYVDDVIDGNILAAHASSAAGEVLNLSTDVSVSINYAFATIAKAMRKSVEPVFEPSRPGDIRESVADVTRAKMVLGFEAKTAYERGVDRTVPAITGANV